MHFFIHVIYYRKLHQTLRLQKVREKIIQSDGTFLRRQEYDVTVICEGDSFTCEPSYHGKTESQSVSQAENSAAGQGT